jgi:cobyrinic acid a,c-diamide synthase
VARRGLIIAGLSSGSGKTTVTLGLLRALQRKGHDVSAAKSGPDYIDTAFLTAACGRAAINLDSFAMNASMLGHLARNSPAETLIIEGAMGLFDGTDGERGSSAQLAGILGLGVVLVIDARHQAQTAAAIAAGLANQLPNGAYLAGVVLNQIASPRHFALINAALAARKIPCFGAIPISPDLTIPSRHLGLVQSADLAAAGTLEVILDAAADCIDQHLDITALLAAANTITPVTGNDTGKQQCSISPPGQRIAMAHDAAFGFHYAHMLSYWQGRGAEIMPFSPLNDEAPSADADFVFLPGGYPELHLPTLVAAKKCKAGLNAHAKRNIPVYGECGGYMMLGERIIDAHGNAFQMSGLLALETSFAIRKLHLGYRLLTPLTPVPWLSDPIIAHEFHYTQATMASGDPLFTATDAGGNALADIGLVNGSVAGSYAHIIT